MAGSCFWFIVIVCLIQFVLIVNLTFKLQSTTNDTNNLVNDIVTCPQTLVESSVTIPSQEKLNSSPASKPKVYGGVAATLLLHAPAWFQRRYTMMIQNTVANIPDDWVVQIFYTAVGQSKKGKCLFASVHPVYPPVE